MAHEAETEQLPPSFEEGNGKRRSWLSPESPSYKWWVTVALMLGILTQGLNFGTVNVALPSMMTNLRADVETIQWVSTAFMITRTVVMPTVGWVAAVAGPRTFYLAGLLIYIVGSVLCGLSWSISSLVFFRVIQAVGAGPLFPLSMGMLYEVFPAHQRGLAMGIFMAGISVGPAIGPSIGGYLVEHINWRMIFYLNLPIGIISLGAVALVLPKSARPRYVSLDKIGLLTMVAFLVPLLLALIQGRHEGWDSRYIQTLFAIAIVSGITFLVVELRQKQPLVELGLFKIIPFSAASGIFLIGTMGEFASSFLIALFLQRVMALTPFQAGQMLLPGALTWGFSNLISGRLADKVNNRVLISVALIMIAVAFFRFSHIDMWSSTTYILSLFVVQSFARGLLQSPLINLLMVVLPKEKVMMGSGLRGLMNGLGSTFGVSMAAIFVERQQVVHALAFAEDQGSLPIGAEEAVAAAQDHLYLAGEWDLLPTKAMLLVRQTMLDEAAVLAYRDCYLAIALSSLVSLMLTLFLRSPDRRR
ncbi:MAG TPA: DHA2 family efflux MFS transporter permease subunit [Alphaproteobacteria bacterium]|nr:DHA2 family efflux MFS transporter permease subunit [Alphaproteobacteria bacterium]